MILFIVSEVMFFFAFFWAFFHSSLSPTFDIGGVWPPEGIEVLNPWEVPLLNTVLLLSSGATVTWAHHAIVARVKKRRFHRTCSNCDSSCDFHRFPGSRVLYFTFHYFR